MGDLACRMDSAIRAARSDAADRLIGNPGYRLIQAELNARRMTLDLPTIVMGAIVFQAAGEPAQILHLLDFAWRNSVVTRDRTGVAEPPGAGNRQPPR